MTEPVDILSFDAVANAELGFEFELTKEDGAPTGVMLTVIGHHSEAVSRWFAKQVDIYAKRRLSAEKDSLPEVTFEQGKEDDLENAMVRVKGWRNVKQDYDPALMRSALVRNPHWIGQIIAKSETVGNFTKPQ